MRISDIIILSLIILIFLFYTINKYKLKRKQEKFLSVVQGKTAELYQELQEQGYRLVAYDCSMEFIVDINGKKYNHNFHTPFIVKRKKQSYLVYIKKGKDTLRLSSKNVREYFITQCKIFNVSGVLIIDPDKVKIRSLIINKLTKG